MYAQMIKSEKDDDSAQLNRIFRSAAQDELAYHTECEIDNSGPIDAAEQGSPAG